MGRGGLAGDSIVLLLVAFKKCLSWAALAYPSLSVSQEPVLQRSLEGWDLEKQFSSILCEVSVLHHLDGWDSYLGAQCAPALYFVYLGWTIHKDSNTEGLCRAGAAEHRDKSTFTLFASPQTHLWCPQRIF